MIKILPICKNKQYVKECAKLLYDTWGENKENGLYFWETWVSSSFEKTDNQHYVILNDNDVIGTFAVMHCDLRSRQDLFPWIGNLVIKNKIYKDGFKCFSVLNDFLFDIAKELNCKRFYCYTVHKPAAYIRYGWEVIGEDYDQKGNKITLMHRDCNI